MYAAVALVDGREEAIGCSCSDMWSAGSSEFEEVEMTSRRVFLVEDFGTRRLAGDEYVVVVVAAAAAAAAAAAVAVAAVVVAVGGLKGERRRVWGCY